MLKSGPIIIIEDDIDDQYTLKKALTELDVWNDLIFFENGPAAFEYLKNVTRRPYFIICDMNLPIQSGIEFKYDIDNNPITKALSIPFILYSNSITHSEINESFKQLTIQGFLKKNHTYQDLKKLVQSILEFFEKH